MAKHNRKTGGTIHLTFPRFTHSIPYTSGVRRPSGAILGV